MSTPSMMKDAAERSSSQIGMIFSSNRESTAKGLMKEDEGVSKGKKALKVRK
jgi:hypothetical protein